MKYILMTTFNIRRHARRAELRLPNQINSIILFLLIDLLVSITLTDKTTGEEGSVKHTHALFI